MKSQMGFLDVVGKFTVQLNIMFARKSLNEEVNKQASLNSIWKSISILLCRRLYCLIYYNFECQMAIEQQQKMEAHNCLWIEFHFRMFCIARKRAVWRIECELFEYVWKYYESSRFEIF